MRRKQRGFLFSRGEGEGRVEHGKLSKIIILLYYVEDDITEKG
jgi:hypothetical protein